MTSVFGGIYDFPGKEDGKCEFKLLCYLSKIILPCKLMIVCFYCVSLNMTRVLHAFKEQ